MTRPSTAATRCLPRAVRPAVHALYGFVRGADEIVDGPRRPGRPAERRAALDAWQAELERGLARRALRATRSSRALVDAGRAPRPAAAPAAALHGARCAWTATARADGGRRRARRYMDGIGRDRRAHHGAAARRPGDVREDVARLGVAFQLTNFIRDVREDWALDRVYLPGPARGRPARAGRRPARAPRARRRAGRPRTCAVRRDPARRAGPCAAPMRPGIRVARAVYGAGPGPRRAQRLRRPRAPGRARTAGRPPARRRAALRGDDPSARRRAAPSARRCDGDARRRPRLRRELRRAGRRPRAGRGAPGADVLVVDRYEIGERATSRLRRPDAVAARDGRRRRRSARSCRT